MSTERVNIPVDMPLPFGWSTVVREGKTVFVHADTKRTSWYDPRVTSKYDKDLPEGWEVAIDGNGTIYYIDHTNEETSREHPMNRRHKSKSTSEISHVVDPALAEGAKIQRLQRRNSEKVAFEDMKQQQQQCPHPRPLLP